MPLPKTIKISIDHEEPRTVPTEAYVKGKLASLKEFGYATLTADAVREQLQHALDKHDMDNGLNVIGMFIKGDLVFDDAD